jgi:hypothetical protein
MIPVLGGPEEGAVGWMDNPRARSEEAALQRNIQELARTFDIGLCVASQILQCGSVIVLNDVFRDHMGHWIGRSIGTDGIAFAVQVRAGNKGLEDLELRVRASRREPRP